jgi:prevent-host-death family protein
VAGAENVKARLWHHWLDKYAQLASADEPVVVSGILSEAEIHVAGPLILHHVASRVPHFGFHAPAADGAEHGAILTHQQLGAFIARNGPVDLDNGSQRALLAEAAKADHFLVNVHAIELYRGEVKLCHDCCAPFRSRLGRDHVIMTIVMSVQIAAGEFKAKCLSVLDEVQRQRKEVVITKRGKPVAKLVPIVDSPVSFIGSMKGTMEIIGDIVSPIDVQWEADE